MREFLIEEILNKGIDVRLVSDEIANKLKAVTYISPNHPFPTSLSLEFIAEHLLDGKAQEVLKDPESQMDFITGLYPLVIEQKLENVFPPEIVIYWNSLNKTKVNEENACETSFIHLEVDKLKDRSAKKEEQESPRLAVIGAQKAVSGLGNALRASISALDAAEIGHRIVDFSLEEGMGEDIDNDQNLSCLLYQLNLENIPDAIGYTNYDSRRTPYRICFTFWEIEKFVASHRLGADCVDELWVASDFVKEIYASVGIPVTNVGVPVVIPDARVAIPKAALGFAETTCVFMYSFDCNSSLERKNPLAVIHAFKRAFSKYDQHVGLILKTQNAGSGFEVRGRLEQLMSEVVADSRIRFINKSMSKEEFYGLKDLADCYVSLHRAEGFGYGPAEAMLLGKPVIVTNYSGTRDFATSENAFLVDYSMIPVNVGEYYYESEHAMWADPDVEHAAVHMKAVFNNYEAAAVVAKAGQRAIQERYSPSRVGMTFRNRLSNLGVI